ncbi:MAG: YgjP-like metallopeptidase domain-containing protein, partial [Chloroflexota bacterium]
MSSKWASVSTAGQLSLDSELLSLPRALGEFVIVHELAHLLAPNHGPLHSSYMPDWLDRQRKLQERARSERGSGSVVKMRGCASDGARRPLTGPCALMPELRPVLEVWPQSHKRRSINPLRQ